MVTDPYRAVTTADVNIGIVITLQHPNGTVYGVVGADITLVSLTNYITTAGAVGGGEMMLTDQHGIVLASKDAAHLYENISYLLRGPDLILLDQE